MNQKALAPERQLVRRQGLSRTQAVDAMARLVSSV